jgi:hypothetical protein
MGDDNSIQRQSVPPYESAVDALLQGSPAGLPSDYIAFLRRFNGGEGPLSFEPGWVQLWAADEVLDLNAGYGVCELWPDYLAIGTNGGGELMLFERLGTRFGPIVMIPYIPLDPDLRVGVCSSFAHLINGLDTSEAPSN